MVWAVATSGVWAVADLAVVLEVEASEVVWGTVSSEDFRATWGVEWGSVARWVVAITVHFEISDTLVLFNFIRISFCEGDMRTFQKDTLSWFCLPTFGALIS